MPTKKTILIISLGLLLLITVLARNIILPFVLAAIFAYIFNPVINYIVRKTKINRFLTVVIFFVILIGLLVYLSSWVTWQIINESSEITKEISNVASFSADHLKDLPEWTIAGQSFGVQSIVTGSLDAVTHTALRVQSSVVPIFSGALGYILKFLVFIVAFFYLLKDGSLMIEKVLGKLPKHYETETREIGKKINTALGGYLRGQLLLILIMASASSLVLSLMGVKYAIILGLVTGFFELIPFIGPVVAGGLAATVAFINGSNYFGFDPTTLAVFVILVYFVLRQLEDYFINPLVLGRLTRLHPLLVIFATLVGGTIAGPVGFVLGVPVAASGRILLEYFWVRAK